MACERSRANGTIRHTLKTVLLQLSALPLATRPLATARPCHARPTHHPSVSPATQQQVPIPRARGMKSLSRGRLALSPGRWRIVRKCKPGPAPGAQKYRFFCAYCRIAVLPLWMGRYVLLHCCCCTAVLVLVLVWVLLLLL